MNCPACDHGLRPATAGGITVDVCERCGGLWFDRFELKEVDERNESAGESLLEARAKPHATVDVHRQRLCPRCDTSPMHRHFFSVRRQVSVDQCPRCDGYWLDPGELKSIRDEFATEGERVQAAEQYFTEIFGNDLAAMRTESQAKLQQARKIAWMLRFICPSYYVPGKQKWGAF